MGALATADTLGKVEKPGFLAGRPIIAGRPAAARRQKQYGWKKRRNTRDSWKPATSGRPTIIHVFTKLI